jgi:GNAT superfamily N-acetyltransferase
VEHYRRIYREVGAAWRWFDRRAWEEERLAAHLDSPNVAVWELHVDGEFAGYCELVQDDERAVEIAYFGLLSRFFGRRFGAAMLSAAADEAWRMGATRVWLHTCTLDSPRAMPNYLARGFVRTREETYDVDDAPPDLTAERF